MGALPSVVRNGDTTASYPGCVNLSFHCVEGESLLMALKVKPSFLLHVLRFARGEAHLAS
jgi:cysteine sulfinate desulfinase/cysteine desulfurase-like protein